MCATYPPSPGGIARHVSDLARTLAGAGFEVHVLTRDTTGAPAEEIITGVRVKRILTRRSKRFSTIRFIQQTIAYVFYIKPDLIHSHELYLPSLVAVLAKLIFRIPLIITIHTQGPSIGDIAVVQRARLGKFRWFIFRQLVDKFIAISQVLETEMSVAGIPASQQVRIPNSIDMTRFAPVGDDAKCGLRQDLHLPNGPIIVMSGRLVWEKRVQNMLEIWPSIRDKFSDACLLVIGSGEYEQDFRGRRIPGVFVLGETEDVVSFLQASDILVMLSVYEGFSLSTLEGLACALPVVATPVGAVPEMIVHRKTGWIVPVDDLDALRNAICTLLENPAVRSELGKSGHKSVVHNYSLEISLERLISLYNQSLGIKTTNVPNKI